MNGAERFSTKTWGHARVSVWEGSGRGVGHLAALGRLLAELERGLAAVREEEALHVEHPRALDARRDLRRGQVRLLELLRRAQRGHQTPAISGRAGVSGARGGWAGDVPVVARDDDGACAGALALLDQVALVEALALVRGLELLRELVVADAAREDDGARREDVLGVAGENGRSPGMGTHVPPLLALRFGTRHRRRRSPCTSRAARRSCGECAVSSCSLG